MGRTIQQNRCVARPVVGFPVDDTDAGMDGDVGLFGGPFAETGETTREGEGAAVGVVFVDNVLVGDLFGFAVAWHDYWGI